ncbi:MAG: family 20 glycosylhydrolase [Sphingobacteriales bacterium]|nr:family 20 glycosylhydrolase [Sphingobacteriales bacterium]MBI3719174.1 family 20 glycosylhydrolase [Sphingobacteriales bacterium]
MPAKIFTFIVIVLFKLTTNAQVSIIPEPVSIVTPKGEYKAGKQISIAVTAGAKSVADLLKERLTNSGINCSVAVGEQKASISLSINKTADKTIGKEGYQLSVGAAGVTISANDNAGLFYGVQTLLQLFPAEVEKKNGLSNTEISLPYAEITDYPRFGWRGLMFDVSRHFFTKQEVKDFIDQMVKYKYNILHWHLTDDEGWRVEIKSLPKLTSVGAWNVKKEGYFGTFSAPTPDEPRNYGGFYTQEDIKEVVAYAKERFVNILPEVDVPGHSLAAITAYPELSCSGGKDNHGVCSGESIKDWSTHTALVDDNLCPANENVYVFLDKVFTELAQLFPFEYIHTGGDETFKTYWEKSDAVKALMKKEGLKNMEEVQSYFSKRVEKIVESKGKKFMGWDEILEGGLAPNAVVMSWRGMKGGIEAAKQNHEVVMSPTDFVYLDYVQGNKIMEPRIYASLRLKKTYQFEPVPDGVDAKFIKGGQGNIWTEQMYTIRHLQYMVWPRAFAVAEAVWSPKAKRDWKTFIPRVEDHFKRFDAAQVKYAPSMYEPDVAAAINSKGELVVTLTPEIDGLNIHYSFDNTFPDNFYPVYSAPVTAPKDAVMMRIISYKNGKQVGRMITMPVDDLKKLVKK